MDYAELEEIARKLVHWESQIILYEDERSDADRNLADAKEIVSNLEEDLQTLIYAEKKTGGMFSGN